MTKSIRLLTATGYILCSPRFLKLNN